MKTKQRYKTSKGSALRCGRKFVYFPNISSDDLDAERKRSAALESERNSIRSTFQLEQQKWEDLCKQAISDKEAKLMQEIEELKLQIQTAQVVTSEFFFLFLQCEGSKTQQLDDQLSLLKKQLEETTANMQSHELQKQVLSTLLLTNSQSLR